MWRVFEKKNPNQLNKMALAVFWLIRGQNQLENVANGKEILAVLFQTEKEDYF